MKAINKLQHSIALRQLLSKRIENPISISSINSAIDNYLNEQERSDEFFSQPFKPDLITELFEGWKCVSHGEDGYEYNYKGEYIIEVSSDLKTLNMGYLDDKEIIPLMPELKLPKTLDTFLSTLNEQMGGEFTFKPKIVNEYL